MSHQSFSQWLQSPIQGAIPRQSPFSPTDEQFLLESLTECRVKLIAALERAQRYPSLPDLAIGIGDALQGIHEAAAVVVEPEIYHQDTDDTPFDVATEAPSIKGKIESPSSAFDAIDITSSEKIDQES